MIDNENAINNRTRRNVPIDDVIAQQKLILKVGDQRQEVVVQIGRPYAIDDAFCCPVAAWGLFDRFPDIFGAGSLQSLYLAMKLLATVVPERAEQMAGKRCYADIEGDDTEDVEFTFDQLFPNSLSGI